MNIILVLLYSLGNQLLSNTKHEAIISKKRKGANLDLVRFITT